MPTRRDFLQRTAGAAAAALPLGTSTSSAAAPERLNQGSSARKEGVRDYARELEAARAAASVTGASFAYWDGTVLHTAVAGLRNSITGDPVTADTLMHIGSITKVMNAALTMQLVDEGAITLEDPVLEHLPELRTRDMQALNRITCAMLLNHTSGINGDWLPEYGPDQERIVDTIVRCAQLGQLFQPGEETSYCNVATVIAGYLVQQLRRKSWYTLIKERIYEPLGLEHALVDPLEVPRFRVSVGDLTDADSGRLIQTTRPFLAPSFAPAGSTQMSTATDLVSFARAMIGGGVGTNGARILSAASAQRMMQRTADFVPVAGKAQQVGLGWMIQPGGVLSHGGGGPGVRSALFAHPQSGRVATLLTNCDRGEALTDAFLDPIVQSWTGMKPVKPQRQAGSVDTRAYEGVFEDNVEQYIVSGRPGGLALRTRDTIDTFDNFKDEDSRAVDLYPLGDDTFEGQAPAPADGQIVIRFIRPGADGRMRFLSSWERLLRRVR